MIIYSIYKFVNTINGKCYIGFTQDIQKRLDNHKSYSKTKDTAFYRAVRKYGWDAFKFEILYQSLDQKHCLNEMEKHFILENNSYGIGGYNSTKGGEGKISETTDISKEKMSRSRNRRFPAKDIHGNTYQITKDDPRFLSGELVGINKNIKPSEETLKKLSIVRKNNKARLGIPHSPEIRKLISERTSQALKGKPKRKVECPHCHKIGAVSPMKRFHFDFCKKK